MGGDLVERSADLPASPDRVWEALTEAGELSAWFGAEATGDFRPRGRITFRWEDGRERAAVIEELEPPTRLSFRWLPFERHASGETLVVGAGRVEIALEGEGSGTRITVAERGSVGGLLEVGR